MVIVITKLKILQHQLSKLEMVDNIEPRDEFIKCVKDRIEIYNFIRELESLIKSSLFLDFVVFSVLICALLFQASQVIVNEIQTLNFEMLLKHFQLKFTIDNRIH
jgi:hypothetical protein